MSQPTSKPSRSQQLMQHPMDRREFLVSTGAALLALAGVTTIMKSFGLHHDAPRSSAGYGASAYGGTKHRN